MKLLETSSKEVSTALEVYKYQPVQYAGARIRISAPYLADQNLFFLPQFFIKASVEALIYCGVLTFPTFRK